MLFGFWGSFLQSSKPVPFSFVVQMELENYIPCCESYFWVLLTICVILLLFASITSGLALGLLSFNLVDLEVLVKSGQPQAQKNAGRELGSAVVLLLKVV